MNLKVLAMAGARKIVRNDAVSAVQAKILAIKSRMMMASDKRSMIVVLSLGKGGHSFSAARAARALGMRVVLVSPRPVPHEMAFAHYLIRLDPLTEVDAIIDALRPLPIKGVTISIKHILLGAQAKIAEALGLISVGHEVAHLCNDKFAWRNALQKAGCSHPRFSDTYADVSHLTVIQKPKTGTGSKGVALLEPHSKAAANWDPKGDLSVGEEIYWEEYLEGEQFDVEGVSENGVHRMIAIIKEKYELTDKLFPPRYFLFNPELPPETANLLEQETYRVLDASGVRNGAWHVESRIVDGKLVPIDFANRMGYERFMSRASGLDFARQHVSVFVPEIKEPFVLAPRMLVQFFAKTKEELDMIKALAAEYPGNVFDRILKPFFMGTVTYQGMIVLESDDKKLFWEMTARLPLDETDRPK